MADKKGINSVSAGGKSTWGFWGYQLHAEPDATHFMPAFLWSHNTSLTINSNQAHMINRSITCTCLKITASKTAM